MNPETNCEDCGNEFEVQKDGDVKVCNTCKLRWHYRDDDDSWRCCSIATENDLWTWLMKDISENKSLNEIRKNYELKRR